MGKKSVFDDTLETTPPPPPDPPPAPTPEPPPPPKDSPPVGDAPGVDPGPATPAADVQGAEPGQRAAFERLIDAGEATLARIVDLCRHAVRTDPGGTGRLATQILADLGVS